MEFISFMQHFKTLQVRILLHKRLLTELWELKLR